VVAGDSKGELRLYSDISKRAKTALPGLGGQYLPSIHFQHPSNMNACMNTSHCMIIDGVIGVDVTEDGKYVLATTKAYLLLIPTSLPGQFGFSDVLCPLSCLV
jgi:hypothetical protein